jgi:hypothetical protein
LWQWLGGSGRKKQPYLSNFFFWFLWQWQWLGGSEKEKEKKSQIGAELSDIRLFFFVCVWQWQWLGGSFIYFLHYF